MIATLDTNVLVSGLLFQGPPSTVVEGAIEGPFTFATSPAILAELEGVLSRPRFGLDASVVHVLMQDIESVAMIVYPQKRHAVIERDPADDAVIDCAVEAGAQYIVSGDRHLLLLESFDGIMIAPPASFVQILAAGK